MMKTETMEDLLAKYSERRDRIHGIIERAKLNDPLQAAVDYAALNQPAMYANTFFHGVVGRVMPWGVKTSAIVAGGLLGPVAVLEGGTPENLFRDSHTLMGLQFVESVAGACKSEIPAVSPYAQTVIDNAFPDPSSLQKNLGPYDWSSKEGALFMVGTSLALEHSAARSKSGRDELGMVAQCYQKLRPELDIDLSWLTSHSSEEGSEDDTLEDEHFTFIRTAAVTALEATGNIEPLDLAMDQWYSRLAEFFEGWVLV